MRHRLFRFGALLLVAILLLAGVSGCQKEASVRVPEGSTGGTQGTPATGAGTVVTPTDSGLISPVGGATVISALTPEPGGGTMGTPGPATTASITPTLELPTPVVILPGPTQPAAGSEPEYTLYTVQNGDTLFSIAGRHGTTVDAIVSANGLMDPNTIAVGQVLKIPKSGTIGTQPGGPGGCRYYYTVLPGDWIWEIGRKYNVEAYDILKANDMTIDTGRYIQPGDRLCIP
jgi:LysM repeat protein